MNRVGRLIRICFPIFILFASIFAFAGENGEYPVIGYRIVSQNPDLPPVSVSGISIPAKDEARFVSQLLNRTHLSDPLIIVHTDGDIADRTLSLGPDSLSGVGRYRIARKDLLEGRGSDPLTPSGKRAPSGQRQYTLEGVERAGTWVAINCTGLFSAMFYITADVGHATAAALLSATLQVLANVYPEVFWGIMNRSGEVTRALAKRVMGSRIAKHPLTFETGKTAGALIFNFITTSAFTLALNFPNVMATYGTYENLAWHIAATASFGLFSGNTWDIAVAKWVKDGGGELRLKTAKMVTYGKQLFLAVVSPLMFMPEMQGYGMSILGVFGTLGIGAAIFDGPFIRTAENVIKVMENSSSVDRFLNAFQSLENAGRKVVLPGLCRGLFQASF